MLSISKCGVILAAKNYLLPSFGSYWPRRKRQVAFVERDSQIRTARSRSRRLGVVCSFACPTRLQRMIPIHASMIHISTRGTSRTVFTRAISIPLPWADIVELIGVSICFSIIRTSIVQPERSLSVEYW